MQNKYKIVELFKLLDKINENQYEDVKFWLKKQFKIISGNSWDIGNLCFIFAQYLKCSKDLSLFEEYENQINALFDKELLILNKDNDIMISQIGIIYGGLKGINNYVNRQDLGFLLKRIREFLFTECIEQGMVINFSTTNKITYDILLACSPFGLFEPEDLVLVETVKELYKKSKNAEVLEILLLANYYIEQGSYYIVKELFDNITMPDNDFYSEELLILLKKKLGNKLKANELTVIHKPYGNNNPYEPLPCERFPKIVTQDDVVQINAQIWPENEKQKLLLKLMVNDNEDIIKGAVIKNKDSYYQWHIGPFKPNDKVLYQFIIVDNNKMQENRNVFGIDICQRQRLFINECINRGNHIEFKCRMANGADKSLYLQFRKQHYMLTTIKPKKNETTDEDLNLINCKELPDNNSDIKQEFLLSSNSKKSKETLCFSIGINCICKVDFVKNLIMISSEKTIVTINDIYINYSDESGLNRIEVYLNKGINESYYGFGERYNDLNQVGKRIDNYVYNQYKDQGIKTYIPIPFYISSAGYGCFLKDNHYSWLDIGKENVNQIHMCIDSPTLTLYFFFGAAKEIISEYTNVTGKPKLLPKWAFGPWMSSNNWDSQSEVEKQMSLTLKYDIPSTVLVIEAWSDEITYYIFNDAYYKIKPGEDAFDYGDFTYPEWGRWPNPKALVEKLHNNGLKCILWQIPVLKELSDGIHHLQKENDKEYAIDRSFIVKNSDDTPYRIPENWFKDSYVLDFTSEEAVNWWFNKRKYIVKDLQIDGFKTDGGECIFGRDLKFSNGASGDEMRNAYPNTYIGAYYNFINKIHPYGGITFSRSGYSGAQNFPAHWAGDERSTFEALKRSLYAGLSSGLSGIPFWGWDLAGFSGDVPTDELYIRATEMAVFCPIMQYHAESKGQFNQDRTPWNIAERSGNVGVIPIFKYFAKLRMNLLPYIYSEAIYCSLTGEPMMRAMLVDYKEDNIAQNIDNQYMFGRKLLVAPIIEKGKRKRNIYLPKGRWHSLFKADIWEGPFEGEFKAEINQIPVFIKENSVIPLALNENKTLGDYTGNSIYDYPVMGLIAVGDSIKEVIDLKEEGTITIEKNRERIVFSSSIEKGICLITIESIIIVNNQKSYGAKNFNGYYIHEM